MREGAPSEHRSKSTKAKCRERRSYRSPRNSAGAPLISP
ncbi:hypothetical protein BURPS305_0356 [Burkholderia pseudomallei 305]|nr:hypothetical protein BURPS305_0356 [Burkholderia pseudomallei 305]